MLSPFWAVARAKAAALRYQVDQKGDFVVVGNTLGFDCGPGVPAPLVGTVGACGSSTSDTAPDVFWRSDETVPTATASIPVGLAGARSTAVLSIPTGATITYARLYWAGVRATADTSVLVERIGSGAFSSTVNADASATATATGASPHTYYQSTADVTALVQAHGVGQYRLSGVDTASFNNQNDDVLFAGWSMIVFYSLPSDPPRNLTIFDGLDLINSNGPSVTVTLSGFLVPNAGFDAKLGAITYEGDDQLTGDSLSFNGVALSNALNPANNFFNGTRSFLGSAVSTSGDLPRLTGGPRSMSGMDLDVVDVTPRLTQGQTSATITASTNQDFYLLGGFVTSISTYKPDFGGATKTFTNVNAHPGGAVLPGDTIEYTISATNTGNDTATNVVLNDPLPAGLSFVPGSIQVTAGPNAGSKTDKTGDDQGEYIAASRTVRVRLGTGANGTTGGTMAINSTATVVFRVKVDATITGVIENQAIITARGQAGAPATDYVSDGNGGGPGAPPTPITVDGCAQNSDCAGSTPYCLTTVNPHACVSCLTSMNCSGMTPTCEPASHTCRGCSTDAECPSTTPVCQPSGACGECSAGNTTHCGGANPACNAATATCVACVDNTTCGGATPECNVATHSCVGCLTGSDCAGSTPVCDPVFLTCRSCGSDSECGGATPACQPTGACGQCSALDSMACTGATPVCDTTTATCVRCTANADCSGTTPVCNTATHTCAGCSSDAQCGGATPACQPTGACGQCSAGNTTACTGGTPVCLTATGTCVRCTANADCSGTTPVCNGGTHTCVGCSSDGQCGGSKPACQPSGACGQCSAANPTACTGTSPVCNAATGNCRGCSATRTAAASAPACQPNG